MPPKTPSVLLRSSKFPPRRDQSSPVHLPNTAISHWTHFQSTAASPSPGGASPLDFSASASPRPAPGFSAPIVYSPSCSSGSSWQPWAPSAACGFASSLRAHHMTPRISSSPASALPHVSTLASWSASPTWLHKSCSFRRGPPRCSPHWDNHASSSSQEAVYSTQQATRPVSLAPCSHYSCTPSCQLEQYSNAPAWSSSQCSSDNAVLYCLRGRGRTIGTHQFS